MEIHEIKKSEIVAVAVTTAQYPPDDLPEVAFAGRSNVGKSSLLNMITIRKKLAKVSGSPGKTETINFYLINDDFRIVDLPGYGYAKISKSVSDGWGRMIETYIENRKRLKKVALLVDIRHRPTAQDVQMYEYLRYHKLEGLVVATKADKVSKSQIRKGIAEIKKTLNLNDRDKIITISSLKKTGRDDLIDELYRACDL